MFNNKYIDIFVVAAKNAKNIKKFILFLKLKNSKN